MEGTIKGDFIYYETPPDDLSVRLLEGRPYAGVSLKKKLSPSVIRADIADARIICIDTKIVVNYCRKANCYLPYDIEENIGKYII